MNNQTSSFSIKRIFTSMMLISIMFISTQSLVANEQEALKEDFLKKIDEIILIVKDKTLTSHTRNSKIVDVLTPMFDFELMAKLSLGKTWKKLNANDKKKFVKLYVQRMENSYSSKLDSYSNEKVAIKEIKQPKKNRIALITDLISAKSNLEIIYKFYKPRKQKKDKNLWLIYDIEILGVSILKADKAQFKEYLKTKNIHELMDVLVQ